MFYVLRWLWGLAAPLLGPVAAFLGRSAAGVGGPILPAVGLLIGVVIVGYVGWRWVMAPPRPPAGLVSVDAVNADRLRAQLEAERRERERAERNAVVFEEMAEQHRREIEDLRQKFRSIRDETKRTDAVLPADDPWLQSKYAGR
jgi:hypothetical protein